MVQELLNIEQFCQRNFNNLKKKLYILGKLGWALLGTTIGKPLMCGFFGGDFIIFRPKKLWRY